MAPQYNQSSFDCDNRNEVFINLAIMFCGYQQHNVVANINILGQKSVEKLVEIEAENEKKLLKLRMFIKTLHLDNSSKTTNSKKMIYNSTLNGLLMIPIKV